MINLSYGPPFISGFTPRTRAGFFMSAGAHLTAEQPIDIACIPEDHR
jgi:hypothetical protein